jgi:hypothetical protein
MPKFDALALYSDDDCLDRMAELITPRVERFVQRILGIARYEYSDGRYPGFASEIIGCHYPLRDGHIEHINRVIVGHLMLRFEQLAYFSNRLDPTLSKEVRASYGKRLQDLGKLFRGEYYPDQQPSPLKQQLVFTLAILHDIGKTQFLNDAGHEERAGELVERVLDRMKGPLGIGDTDVFLGKTLIENHTMLGTLVQGERSAWEVLSWLSDQITTLETQQTFLSYLLLLNSMDLSGYRYLPIILDHYWIERYMDFSTLKALERHASMPVEFAEYRLRQLARSDVSDFGDINEKETFHTATRTEMGYLDSPTRDMIGKMWIRDALYLIISVNKMNIADKGFWNNEYANSYVKLFRSFAEIALDKGVNTLAYRQGDNQNPRTADPPRIEKLLERLREDHMVVEFGSFVNKQGCVEFTIRDDGMIVGL